MLRMDTAPITTSKCIKSRQGDLEGGKAFVMFLPGGWPRGNRVDGRLLPLLPARVEFDASC